MSQEKKSLQKRELPPERELRFYASYWGKIESDCWLGPDGSFYSCHPEEHDQCARYIIDNHWGFRLGISLEEAHITTDDIGNLPPRTLLEKSGYILLNRGRPVLFGNAQLTFSQIRKLIESNITIPKEVGELIYHQDLAGLINLSKSGPIPEEYREDLQRFLRNPAKDIYPYSLPPEYRYSEFVYGFYNLLSSSFSGGEKFGEHGPTELPFLDYLERHPFWDYFEYKVSPSGKLVLIFDWHHHRGDDHGDSCLMFLRYLEDIQKRIESYRVKGCWP